MTIPKRKLGRTNLSVSSLGLGTAEIGFAYGIGDPKLVSDSEAERLLKCAVEMGITYFDTAYFYGIAEERLGKAGISKMDGVVIGTKCAKFLEDGEILTQDEMEKRIREEVNSSLKKLDMDTLTLLYLHGGSKEDIEKGEVLEIIQKLKAEGKVRYVGISMRGEEAANAAIDSGFFDVIQVAHSILDQRMTSEVLPRAKEQNIGVVNRSVLLKGSLTPKGKELPDDLASLKANAQKAQVIADELGVSLPSLAIRFAISNPAVTTALVGTAKIRHLETAAEAVCEGPLPEAVLKKLRKLAIDESAQVDPARWPAV